MRVLLDEHLPHRLRLLFAPETEVFTVGYLGWQGKRNGELLRAAEAEAFDVLVTMDRGIPHEQNLSGMRISILILKAPSNRYADVAPLMDRVNTRLKKIRPGKLVRVGGSG